MKTVEGKHDGVLKSLMGHGPHRYFFQLVALNEVVNVVKIRIVSKEGLRKAVEGHVMWWG